MWNFFKEKIIVILVSLSIGFSFPMLGGLRLFDSFAGTFFSDKGSFKFTNPFQCLNIESWIWQVYFLKRAGLSKMEVIYVVNRDLEKVKAPEDAIQRALYETSRLYDNPQEYGNTLINQCFEEVPTASSSENLRPLREIQS